MFSLGLTVFQYSWSPRCSGTGRGGTGNVLLCRGQVGTSACVVKVSEPKGGSDGQVRDPS